MLRVPVARPEYVLFIFFRNVSDFSDARAERKLTSEDPRERAPRCRRPRLWLKPRSGWGRGAGSLHGSLDRCAREKPQGARRNGRSSHLSFEQPARVVRTRDALKRWA